VANGCHFEKPLNCYNSAPVGQIAMKFGVMTHFDPLSLSIIKMWIFLKIQDGRRPPF